MQVRGYNTLNQGNVAHYVKRTKSMPTYISRTQPKALSVSESFFIASDTFIHVGAIFLREACNKISKDVNLDNQKYSFYKTTEFYLADNDGRISYRINISDRSLVFWEEFPENWFKLFGLDVEKWECCAKVVLGQVWYGLHNDVIRFCHKYITVHTFVNQGLINVYKAKNNCKSHINIHLHTLPQFQPFEATVQMPMVYWALCSPV